jgi:hypothetical protein
LYLTKEEWDAWRKKHEAKNHSGSGARGGGVGKGHRHDRGHRRSGSSSSKSSNKPTSDECQRCGNMATLTHPKASLTPGSVVEAISSVVEIELKEEKVYVHLDEEKDHDAGTRVLDTEATNHMSGCRATFMKLDTMVLGAVHFGDDSVAWIEGRRAVVFVCKNSKFRSLKGCASSAHNTLQHVEKRCRRAPEWHREHAQGQGPSRLV